MKKIMTFKPAALAVAASLASSMAMADGLDFHGYVRQQVGTTSEGGNLQCFHGASPIVTKFRLGNECDNYSEYSWACLLVTQWHMVQVQADAGFAEPRQDRR